MARTGERKAQILQTLAAMLEDPKGERITTALLAASPGMPKDDDFGSFIGRRLQTIEGSVPAIGRFPSGCRFRNRCAHETASCAEIPAQVTDGDGHRFRCWNPVQEG